MKENIAYKIVSLTQAGYEKISDQFSDSRQQIWPIFENLSVYAKEGDKVLDLGCGNGRLLQVLKDKNITYLGVDSVARFIEIARSAWTEKINARVDFQLMDISQDLLIENDSVDEVFCLAVFNHLPSIELQKKLLERLSKILKKDGYLLMTNWNLWKLSLSKKTVYKYFFEKLMQNKKVWQESYGFNKKELGLRDILTAWQSNKEKAYLYYHAFTVKELKKVLQACNFKIIQNYYERKGQPASWWNGDNIVTIAKKI